MYEEYQPFNNYFQETYKKEKEKYPFAMMYLDLALRESAAGYHQNLESLMKAAKKNAVAASIYKIIVGAALLNPKKTKIRVLTTRLPRFKVLREKIKENLEDLEPSQPLPEKISIKKIIRIAALKEIELERTILSGLYFWRIANKIQKIGPSITKEKKTMEILNKKIKSEFDRVKKISKQIGLEVYITSDDQSYASQIVCKALRETNTRIITIAHGYIQNKKLISIAPSNSDVIATWTDIEKNSLERALNSPTTKIISIGCPKTSHTSNTPPKEKTKNQILFIADPIFFFGKKENKISIINELEKISSDSGFSFKLRLHPKDLETKNPEISISSNPPKNLEEEFSESLAVIGFDSSALFEAAAYGIQSIQVLELSNTRFEGVEQLPIQEIKNIIKEKKIKYNVNNQKIKPLDISKITEEIRRKVVTGKKNEF